MSFMFRPAVREGVSLLIGLAGGTGSGKTYSANLLATGLAGGARYAVIDTEAGRAKHYADKFAFDHGDLTPPFTPARYLEAITDAEAAGYPVIVIDSMSHEHAGDGGLLDMHEAELDRMAGNDLRKREAVKMAAWIKPKMQHKHMVQKLLQLRSHVVMCFRAEPKIEMVKNPATGKLEITDKKTLTGRDGWVPVTEKNLAFELTASFLLMADRPGVPLPIKLPERFKPWFPPDAPITDTAGVQLAAWAKGDAPPATVPNPVTVNALERIAQASTPAALAALNGELKLLGGVVSPEDIATLRQAYAARRQAVAPKKTSKAALTASDIPFSTEG